MRGNFEQLSRLNFFQINLERVKDDNFASSKAAYSLAEYYIADKNSKKMFSIYFVSLYLILLSVNQA